MYLGTCRKEFFVHGAVWSTCRVTSTAASERDLAFLRGGLGIHATAASPQNNTEKSNSVLNESHNNDQDKRCPSRCLLKNRKERRRAKWLTSYKRYQFYSYAPSPSLRASKLKCRSEYSARSHPAFSLCLTNGKWRQP